MTTAHELTNLTGLTYRQIDFWTRTGYLTTTGNPTPGSGYQRHYEPAQVAHALHLANLTRAGLPVHLAHQIAIDLTYYGVAHLGHLEIRPTTGPAAAPPPAPANVHPIRQTGDAA